MLLGAVLAIHAEISISHELEEPPKKYFRLFPGNEVRLMGAYFVTCTGYEKDENGNVTVVHATYDTETRAVPDLMQEK